MDELQSQIAYNHFVRDESWLRLHIPDATVELAGRTIHRHDRTEASGKSIGGGLCVYVLENWCSDSRVIDTYCSPDLEAMSVQCRPFYLPRELTAAFVTAVYIPPGANVSMALGQLQLMVAKQQRAHPDGGTLIKQTSRLFSPNSTSTRGKNIQAYTPLRRQTKPATPTIKAWPGNALAQLQDCFACTEWSIFEDQDLDKHKSVLFYIRCCVEHVTEERRIREALDDKRSPDPDQSSKLGLQDGDRDLYSTARADLRRGLKLAKDSYKRKIEGHLTDNNYKGQPPPTSSSSNSSSLAKELNSFFARFETTPTHLQSLPPPGSSTPPLSLQEHECLERSVSQHIRDCLPPSLPPSLDPDQFAYRANQSTEDAIAVTLHTALSYLENKKSYLSDEKQSVRLGPHHSSTITLSTTSPQGCVLSPLLYALYTHDCSPAHPTNRIIKYVDDTTVVGLICNSDKTAYRAEEDQTGPHPLLINREQVETVNTFRFLGTHISADHSWTHNIGVLVKKAQQRLHFLRVLRKGHEVAAGLLSLLGGERTDVLSGRLVHRLHSQGQEGSAEGHKQTLPKRSSSAYPV
ncbi:hypothetical protein N1851_002601 [Merluccius polli]|uniref:Alkylated DNA repair protein AlkB homologue 8 N-terminal domain-containing protein n=1 Tax=Merluccius polli TaxID=89951 RepID=A0AA47NBC2_MERPO|nr:hypothetical protein N1851_002601 [Merluccius polli]